MILSQMAKGNAITLIPVHAENVLHYKEEIDKKRLEIVEELTKRYCFSFFI